MMRPDEILPPCPHEGCDANYHHWHWLEDGHVGDKGDASPERLVERHLKFLNGDTCDEDLPYATRCYSAHAPNVSESPTGSPGGDFRDKLAGDSPDKTIRRWLDRSREYPTTNGRLGWVADRDELIALLSECSPRGISASVIPVAVPGGDMVGFYVQTSIHFARSELSAIGEPRRAAEGDE